MDRKKIEKILDEMSTFVNDPFDRFEVDKRCEQIRKEIYEPDDGLPESVKLRNKVIANTPRSDE